MSTPSNYFDLFALPQDFRISLSDLEKKYRELQTVTHPDRFADADDRSRLQAVQQTSLINDAFETLKSPLKRAAYLLSLAGMDPDRHDQSQLQGEFLVTQMQLREELETLAGKADMEGLEAMKAAVQADIDEDLSRFETCLNAGESTGAKGVYHRLQFLFKLLEEIDAAEEDLLDY